MDPLFPTLNVDLIFNLPGQTVASLKNDLSRILETGVRQVTTYPLMSSPGVARDMARQLGRSPTSREYEMFRIIETRMEEEGLVASSPWCYSRQLEGMTDEYIVDAPEYVGLGSGAFSMLDGALYVNTFSVTHYSERIRAGRMSIERMRKFQPWELMHYQLMMGLFGLDLNRVDLLEDCRHPVRMLLALELFLLRRAGAFQPGTLGRFVLSHSGRYLSLAMMREFFAAMNRVRDEARALLPGWQRGELCPEVNGVS
jgi:coproporphyrinogen III oxidase-like Fe-S oxidoreductase